jgi:hypothetical protein
MDCQNGSACLLRKDDSPEEKSEHFSLKNVSLEERRKAAKKPLFLVRYE